MKKIKSRIKRLIHFLNLGWIIGIIRGSKYVLLDAIGTIFFAAVRLLRFAASSKTWDENTAKNILVVRNDRVGDLVLSTPALRALRQKYFDAKIHLLVNKYAKDLVLNNPNIDKILTEEKEVLNTKYDLAIALHAGFKQNAILFQSRADCRIGFIGAGGGFFLTKKIKDDRRENPRHEIDFTLLAAQKAGADIDNKKLEVSITIQGEKFADKFYLDNNLAGMTIVIHPGARQEILRWSKHSFAKLGELLTSQLKAKIILTGTAKEKELIADILCQMKSKPAVCLDIKLTELVSVLKRASMYVGNITGPMHIACALNISVVAITGLFDSLDDIRYWGPRCDKFEIVRKQGIDAITVEDVYQAVLRLAGENGA
ncbi:MAG: glycosyltransferase family 9 protein [Candidatus Omnitrophica bacterium]|nr:glycosyltransferase family 9 protein [Candidatus Omnitrophota bacterium]